MIFKSSTQLAPYHHEGDSHTHEGDSQTQVHMELI